MALALPARLSAWAAYAWPMTLAKSPPNSSFGSKASSMRPVIGAAVATRPSSCSTRSTPPKACGFLSCESASTAALAVGPAYTLGANAV